VGSVLDQATKLHADFQESKVELLPLVEGWVLIRKKHGLMVKAHKRFL